MKNVLAFLLLLSFTFHGCSSFKKVSIDGIIPAGFENAVISIAKNGQELISSNVTKNRFTLKGVIPEPDFYNLQFYPNDNITESKNFIIYLDGQDCTISFQSRGVTQYPEVKSNSKTQNDLTKFYYKYEITKKDLDLKNDSYQQLVDSLEKVSGHVEDYNRAVKASSDLLVQTSNLWADFLENYIHENPSAQLSAYFISTMPEKVEYDPQKYERIYSRFSDDVKESKYGKLNKKYIDKYMHGASGTKLPVILGKDVHGKTLDMTSLKGKISLVFFWLSSNKDSKTEINAMKEIYAKHHAKGLEIVAICFDKRKERWEQYISENHLPWKNLFDEEGLVSPNFKNFGNSNIPYNFLIGPDLIISERNVPLEQFDLYFNTLKNNKGI